MKRQKNQKLSMKYRGKLLLPVLSICLIVPNLVMAQATIEERQQKALKIKNLFNMAEQAYRENEIEVARETLKTLLAEQPGHPHSIALLRKIRLNGGQIELTRKKNKFNAVILKSVDYKAMNLRQALKILNEQIMVASDKKVIPNFVLRDPNKYMGNEQIELELKNVPAGVVLEHLLKKTGTTAKFSKYSITISPRPSVHKNKVKSIPVEKKEDDEATKTVKPKSSEKPIEK